MAMQQAPEPLTPQPSALDGWAAEWRARTDEWLSTRLAPGGGWAQTASGATVAALEPLRAAMAYSVLAPGKRFRPLVVAAAGHAAGAHEKTLLAASAAVELIHTYSLVHDDLPAMDDDDLRRGRATNHRVYGQATAILVGDALQAAAFEILAEVDAPPQVRVSMVRLLAQAAGAIGMVGGQHLDIHNHADVRRVHLLKTGRLIGAATGLGALAGGVDDEDLAAFVSCGRELGRLFQVVDDVLDDTADERETGKSAGSDARLGRVTSVQRRGVSGARQLAFEIRDRCRTMLGTVPGDTTRLHDLVDYVHDRVG